MRNPLPFWPIAGIAAFLAAVTIVAVIAAIQPAAGTNLGGKSSAWNFGFSQGSSSITDCPTLARNAIAFNAISRAEMREFVSGCHWSERD